jgi:hypothetical protein
MTNVLLIQLYLGLGVGVSDFVAVASIDYVTSSMMNAYKRAYLKGVLRQNVGWYDTSAQVRAIKRACARRTPRVAYPSVGPSVGQAERLGADCCDRQPGGALGAVR